MHSESVKDTIANYRYRLHADWMNNEATTFVVFDQSQNNTGWLEYKPAIHRIRRYGVITKDMIHGGQDYDGVMAERMGFQIRYTEKLQKILSLYDPEWTTLVMEHPIGSQSAKAAWGMAMASQALVTLSIAILKQRPTVYSERDAKMHMFNTHVVEKKTTIKHMWNYWKAQNIKPPEKQWPGSTDKQRLSLMEHVADAMLLLNLHLHKIVQGE